jgi:hypothetical protein
MTAPPRAGVIALHPADIPADAPAPLPGETAWFSGQQLPVQIGVYRRLSLAGTTRYSFFDGAMWLWNKASIDLAAQASSREPSLVQTLPWCGLVAPPPPGYGPMRADDTAGGAA